MAERRISIRITLDNTDAIRGANAQAAAMTNLGQATQQQTHLQAGLTNSFIRGNLAARAISASYLALRDSTRYLVGESVKFEHNMTKIAAITETSGASLRSLEGTIRSLSSATNQNQNELAKAALEMGKMGLTGPQVEEALGGVARLARALDEDLVQTGETVVAVLNAYGFSTSEAARVTDQLAFTVKASALSIESFGVAFSYVGGTAKAAGVDFTELQGSMDVLSNAGIKASTIGTQLRRVIADLSNENSKASQAIGGQTIESLGLVGALQALREKNIDIAGLTEIFGRTASSVSSILIRYSSVIDDLAKKTAEADGVTKSMSDQMNTTFKSNLDGIVVAWADLGIEISKSTGFLKTFAQTAKEALGSISDTMRQTRSVQDFKKAVGPAEFGRIMMRDAKMGFATENTIVGASPEFNAWNAKAAQMEADLKRKENIATELMGLMDSSVKLPANFDPSKQLDMVKIDPKNTYMFNYLQKLYGTDEAGFKEALKSAKVQWALKAEKIDGEKFDTDSLKDPKKVKKFKPNSASDSMMRSRMSNAPLSDENQMWETELQGKVDALAKAEEKAAGSMAKFAKTINLVSSKKEYEEWLEKQSGALDGLRLAQEGVNGATSIFSSFLAEGLISDKENPFQGISDAFGDFAKKMVADLIAVTIRLLIFKAALSAITGGVGPGGFFNMAFNGTGSGGTDFLLKALGGQKFASGTDQIVRSPTSFIAGDGGPERVSVTPRAKMNSHEGGGNNIIVQGDVYDYDRFARKVKMAQESNRKDFV